MVMQRMPGKTGLPGIFLACFDRLQTRNATRFQAEARSVIGAKPERVSEFQLDRIRKICRHAHDHTVFYRERFRQIGLKSFERMTWDQFDEIPYLKKSDFQENLPSMTSDAYPVETLREARTGGTTSSPTKLYIDWEANDRRWAATREWDRKIGYSRGQKIASLWGASQDIAKNMSWKRRLFQEYIIRSRHLSASPLDEATMYSHYETLKRWRPSFLLAYPTPLAIFANFLLRTRLKLNIPAISVTAEPLLEHQRQLITDAFGVRPYNWYGAREAGRIATECEYHNGMHINGYGLHVSIRQDGNELGKDVLGRILITDLWNKGMPMIRYDIGDIGEISTEPCACGNGMPRIMRLEGRSADIFVSSTGQKIPGVSLTNRIVTDDLEYRELQFVQTAIGQFRVLVVPGERWCQATSAGSITSRLEQFMGEPLRVTIEIVTDIPRERSGKLRFCIGLDEQ